MGIKWDGMEQTWTAMKRDGVGEKNMSHGQACYDVFIYIKISALRWSQTYFLR